MPIPPACRSRPTKKNEAIPFPATIPSTETNIDCQVEETNNGNMGKCTDEHGQIIYANLDNAFTLFRDDVRHRGTVIAFMGSANDAIVVSDTPDQILNSAKG
jgi:hypothetical protein